jgi:hypothetical protein
MEDNQSKMNDAMKLLLYRLDLYDCDPSEALRLVLTHMPTYPSQYYGSWLFEPEE